MSDYRTCTNCTYGPHTQRHCIYVVGNCTNNNKHKYDHEVQSTITKAVEYLINNKKKDEV